MIVDAKLGVILRLTDRAAVAMLLAFVPRSRVRHIFLVAHAVHAIALSLVSRVETLVPPPVLVVVNAETLHAAIFH